MNEFRSKADGSGARLPPEQVRPQPRVRKAVFPVAGMGTRFLPATKAVAKEMLPIVDRPVIQYGVEEALAAGIEEIIFVTSRSKRAIEDHFDSATELEQELERAGKHKLLAELRKMVPSHVRFTYVRQHAPLGLGHAVLCARHAVGNEPFAVLLPDDLLDATRPVLAQMAEQFSLRPASMIAVQNVPAEHVQRYGICDAVTSDARVSRIRAIVEKPKPAEAPSTLAVVGRYIFTPAIFDCLREITPGAGGELQLTDGIALLLAREPVFSYRFQGQRYDCGSKQGFIEATLAMALRHPEVGAMTRELVLRTAERLRQDAVVAQSVAQTVAQAEQGGQLPAGAHRRTLSLVSG